jgi:hypothetical protein
MSLVFFVASSVLEYIKTPQLTEQYGHVPRVSVVRANLKARTSACTVAGANPRPTADEVATPAEQTLKNCRRDIGAFICVPPERTLNKYQLSYSKSLCGFLLREV